MSYTVVNSYAIAYYLILNFSGYHCNFYASFGRRPFNPPRIFFSKQANFTYVKLSLPPILNLKYLIYIPGQLFPFQLLVFAFTVKILILLVCCCTDRV